MLPFLPANLSLSSFICCLTSGSLHVLINRSGSIPIGNLKSKIKTKINYFYYVKKFKWSRNNVNDVEGLNMKPYNIYSSDSALNHNSFMCSFNSKNSSACTHKMSYKVICVETEEKKIHKFILFWSKSNNS